MTDGISEDDVTAMRKAGDLGTYLRSLFRRTGAPAPATQASSTYGPRHTPGAWPHGTHPPTSTTCRPDCDCNPAQPPAT